jgi:serine/threonine protein phosphatase 1
MRRTIDYAIADVHGRADLLIKLIVSCVGDATGNGAIPRFVFLGDLIDRGPTSRDCLDIVSDVLSLHDGSVCIRGNHEDMALAVLTSDEPNEMDMERWRDGGGYDTLESYHHDLEIGFEMMRTMHADHLRLMRESLTSLDRCGYFFAHAGINPARTFRDQKDQDLMRIRAPFLNHVGYLEKVVIHGHEVVGNLPVVTENRVSIDTGAYHSGRLTACAIDGDNLRFLQTDGSARNVVAVDPVRLDRGLGTCLDRSFALAA